MNPSHTLYEIAKDLVIPICAGLLSFVALLVALKSLNATNKIARANFELQMTLSHRETWQKIGELKLIRLKSHDVDPTEISELEYLHINFILHNVKNIFDAMTQGILTNSERNKMHMKDIGEFFSFPIPNKVWSTLKEYHDKSFQNFIEDSKKVFRNEPPPPGWLKKTTFSIKQGFQQLKISLLSSVQKMKLRIKRVARNKAKQRIARQRHENNLIQ